jgi:ATP-dependent DNA helicase RecG
VIFESSDGFYIAREDLALRGPGEFLGARQSGAPMLRYANLAEDVELLEQAQIAAGIMLLQYPDAVKMHIAQWLGAQQEFVKA